MPPRRRPELAREGWWGKREVRDPRERSPDSAIAEDPRAVDLSAPGRLRLIFDTNLRTAAAAGKWERIQRTKKALPFLEYDAVGDDRTRPQHRAWDKTILPVDHPWWDAHFPPNGWNCRCSVIQLTAGDMKRRGLEVTDPAPDDGERDWRNRRTGEVDRVPVGIDPGWDYAPGRSALARVAPREEAVDAPIAHSPRPENLQPLSVAPDRREVPLLDSNTPHADAVGQFLARFGAPADGSAVHTDVTGTIVPISDELFRNNDGRFKLDAARVSHILAIAETIIDPDEIWTQWRLVPSGWRLNRSYVAVLPSAGGRPALLAVFSINSKGWKQVTAFPDRSEDARTVEGMRAGYLEFRREK